MKKTLSIIALGLMTASCASIQDNLHTNTSSKNTQPVTTVTSNAEKGLVTLKSPHSVQNTADKLKALIESKGMTVFATVDHQKNAAGVALELRPTQVIMFGNPKVGTPLMQCEQSVAIDLPQKMLISEDTQGQVWLSYNDPEYLQSRHHIQGCDKALNKISTALMGLGKAATAK